MIEPQTLAEPFTRRAVLSQIEDRQLLSHACPTCSAKPNEHCVGDNGDMCGFHHQRVMAFISSDKAFKAHPACLTLEDR